MWIKLGRKDFYLFEKRPPPDTTFSDFAREHSKNLTWARQDAIEVSKRAIRQANFNLEHEANMDRIKNLTPEEAADILSRMDKKGLPTTPIKKTEWGYSPRTMGEWLGSGPGSCSCTSSLCTTSCLTTPCGACKPKDFWRVTDEN